MSNDIRQLQKYFGREMRCCFVRHQPKGTRISFTRRGCSGGSRFHPRYTNHNPENDLFHMDGPAVHRKVQEIAGDFLEKLYPGLSKSLVDIDIVVPHQASKIGLLMLERFGWLENKIMKTI